MKTHVSLCWSVTIFMVAIFCQPGLIARACLPNPTNYWSKAVSVDKAILVQEPDERIQPESDDKQVLAPIIFFVIMLIVFGYIIYQLVKLLDKIIPPPEKKPDPPPNSGNTNYPPIVINPTTGPGIAPASTKSLTINSNTQSWGSIHSYTIGDLYYKDTMEPFLVPVYYDTFWSSGVQATTNMVDWEDSHYRIDCYVASTPGAVFYRYYHYDTNWWNCYFTTSYIASNHCAPAWFDLSDGTRKPNQFFRLDPK